MTAPPLDNVVLLRNAASRRALADAATRLYDAEVALHIARQTGVDAWVAAAYDRLHNAICEHRVAEAAAFGLRSDRRARRHAG